MRKNLIYIVAGPKRRRHRTQGTPPSPLFPRLVAEDFYAYSRAQTGILWGVSQAVEPRGSAATVVADSDPTGHLFAE